MIRKVERKIKSRYRKMCVWCFLIALVIGFVLVKKGVWIHNIVAPVAEKEAAEK